MVGCSGGGGSVADAGAGSAFGLPATGGDGGGGSAANGGGSACAQASQLAERQCAGQVATNFGPACAGVDLCRANCVLSYPCDDYHESSCAGSCSTANDGGGTTPGPTNSNPEGWDASTAGNTNPDCATYAATYCRCLGSAAAADCVTSVTASCNSLVDACSARALAECVVQQNCAPNWLDTCSHATC